MKTQKVEVDADYLTFLVSELEKLQKEVKEKDKEMSEIKNSHELLNIRRKAVYYAHQLTEKYINEIFKALGFKQEEFKTIVSFPRCQSHIDNGKWYEYGESVKINLGARVCTDFASAFLEIGIITPKQVTEDKQTFFKID